MTAAGTSRHEGHAVGLFDRFKKLFASNPKDKLPRVDIDKRFELGGKSGQGSMSKVYRVRDRQVGKDFYLKILDKVKTANFEQRFVGLNRPTEGEIAMSLRHKNVVQTFEYGYTTRDEMYLLMELIEGQGLNFHIENRTALLKGNRINFLMQMAEGLEYIHKSGYIHRDICPRNYMVTDKDKVIKYIDFGLAIPRKPEFCKPGNRTGTADYLAPEIIKRVITDHRVDLFALGVSAYEMITGNKPWDSGRSQQVLLDHINNPPKDPKTFMPNLDDEVAKFLAKAVERDPRDRFQTAADFKEALSQLPKKY